MNPSPNLDINSNEMAIILAASLGDGHINNSQFMYKNKDPELIHKIKNCVNFLFGELKISEKIAKNSIPYILFPAPVKKQLELLGSPKGKKLFLNPGVPEVIKIGTKEQKKFFVQQFFDDEGCVEIENKKISCSQSAETTQSFDIEIIEKLSYGIRYKKSEVFTDKNIVKPNLLLDIKQILFDDFGIISYLNFKGISKYKTKRGKIYISARWELSCYKKEDIIKFSRYIGFSSSTKQKKLDEIINGKKVSKDIDFELLNLIVALHKKEHFFRVKDIQKSLDLERGQIRKRLQTLVKRGILSNHSGAYELRLNI